MQSPTRNKQTERRTKAAPLEKGEEEGATYM
jgi:hypothetical protein